MCLVFIAYRIDGCAPVMIGANREESRRRPVTLPVCCRVRSLRCLLAGADHGPDGTFPEMGTWLGVNEAGIAVAVTNRHDGELAWEDQTRSRGLLAVDLLGFDHPDPASRFARAELGGGGFGGCNYLIAGADAAFVVQAPGAGRVSVVSLTPGVHAMTNLDLDDPEDRRIRFVAREAGATAIPGLGAAPLPRRADLHPGARPRHDLLEHDPRRRGDHDGPHPGRPPRPRIPRFRLPDE